MDDNRQINDQEYTGLVVQLTNNAQRLRYGRWHDADEAAPLLQEIHELSGKALAKLAPFFPDRKPMRSG